MRSTMNMMIIGMIIFLVANFVALSYALRQSQRKSPEFALAQAGGAMAGAVAGPPVDPAKLQAAMGTGQTEYAKCAACHGPDGKGMKVGPALMAPSLVGSEVVLGDPDRAALVVLKGIRKEGDKYVGVMAPLPLDDTALAGVLTYVRNSFGNQGGMVTPEEAAAARTRFNSVPAMVGRGELDGLLAAHAKVAPAAAATASAATSTSPEAAGAPSLAAAVPAVKPPEPWVPIEGIRVVGGRIPSQRPEEAPAKPQSISRDAHWFDHATHGLSQPHPASFRFLEDQGEWFNPFTKPGMTGPYDIRNWHLH